MIYCLVALFALLLLAWPYMLFFEARRLDTPVKAFVYRVGREDISLLLLLLIYNGAAAFTLYTAFKMLVTHESTQGEPFTQLFIFCLVVIPFSALAFVVNRLHYSYWRHDHLACLEVDELQQQVVYTNHDQKLTFAVSDVASIVRYSARNYNYRSPWNGYEYEVYALQDGTEFIVTCLLYYSTSPSELFPLAQRKTVQRRICWLPDITFLSHNSSIQNS